MSQQIWRQRLGHPPFKTFKTIVSKFALPITNNVAQFFCSNCILGKCARLPFHESFCTTSTPLELVHADVWGPAPLLSMNGYRFYVIFVDDFTKYTWMFPLKCKSDVFTTFIQFQAVVENLFGNKIGTFTIDLIGEFLSSVFKTHLVNHDIQKHLGCP